MSASRVRGPYDEFYAAGAQAFDEIRLDRDEEIELTCAALARDLTDGSLVLDIGCGTGRYGAALKAAGYRVIGIDASTAQVEIARKRIEAICASATSIPLDANVADACAYIMMLHQLSKSERQCALVECRRLLNSGGVCFVKTASHDDLRRRPFNDYFPSALMRNLKRYPSVEQLAEEMAEVGLDVSRIENTHSELQLPTSRFLDAVRRRHNTTLAVLPEEEFRSGLAALEGDFASRKDVLVPHYHTLIFARRD